MCPGHIKSHLVLQQKQNQRKIISRNFDLINKTICCKRDGLRTFEEKMCSFYIVHFKMTISSPIILLMLHIFI